MGLTPKEAKRVADFGLAFEGKVAGGKKPLAVWQAWVNSGGLVEIAGRECTITIESRPHYCDRGNYLARLDARGELARDIDGQDGWPRYYFDLERAKLECEAWLVKRNQTSPV